MWHQGIGAAVAGLAFLGIVSTATFGGTGTGGGGPSATYHLTGEHEFGCFGPCLCAVDGDGVVDGSFVLTALPPAPPAVATYGVTDLNMTLTSYSGSQQEITGSGTYRIFASIAPITHVLTYQHRLELYLTIDRQTQYFDSGLAPGGGDFPDIYITVGLGGIHCYTASVFALSSEPQPAAVTGDLNQDGVVNSLDLGIMLSNWSIPATAPGCAGDTPCPADLNHDGRVDSVDLGILFVQWSL